MMKIEKLNAVLCEIMKVWLSNFVKYEKYFFSFEKEN